MSTKKVAKNIDGVDYEVVDVVDAAPVELDPPDPAVVRWQELAAKPRFVEHDGDASKVIPQPRPAWSDPDLDHVGTSWRASYYASAAAVVYASHATGDVDTEVWVPARISATAKLYGNGETSISVLTQSFVAGNPECAVGLTVAETVELIRILHSALDLIRGCAVDGNATDEPEVLR